MARRWFLLLTIALLGMDPVQVLAADPQSSTRPQAGEMAGELAATDVLPPALQALGLNDAGSAAVTTVTKREASQVRAAFVPTSGLQLTVLGTATYGTNGSNGQTAYQFAAGGRTATLAFTPTGMVFVQAGGPAVVGTAPPIVGVMAAATPVFSGLIGVQAGITNMQVVARPDLFLIQTQ